MPKLYLTNKLEPIDITLEDMEIIEQAQREKVSEVLLSVGSIRLSAIKAALKDQSAPNYEIKESPKVLCAQCNYPRYMPPKDTIPEGMFIRETCRKCDHQFKWGNI